MVARATFGPRRVVIRAGLGLNFVKMYRADFGPDYKTFL